ncbi:hypothetical protein AB0H57_20165 [Micromonospora sp. NPDC050686]|uniref:hypothetical protein n=1 Tax=Micromonospora sp. NPDC050686 TaxID=3154631 RepID=UPI0033C3C0BD
MFVSPDTRERLRTQRRQTFFAQLAEPMLVEAEAIGISRWEIVDDIENKGGEPR